jgi:hypothetical protein
MACLTPCGGHLRHNVQRLQEPVNCTLLETKVILLHSSVTGRQQVTWLYHMVNTPGCPHQCIMKLHTWPAGCTVELPACLQRSD